MFDIEACVLTDVGRVRTNNEDSVSLVRPNGKALLASHGVLALVADGMGGHEGGELASKLAVDEIARSYYASIAPPLAALDHAIRSANRAVYQASCATPALKGMGTTCIAAVVRDDRAWWAWVGDSRLYLLRDRQIYRLSEDHTVVQELVRRGLLGSAEALNHPDRSVLERALGTRKEVTPALGSQAVRLNAGDRLLLCSDGLHDLIEDQEFAERAGAGAIAESAQALLHLALERGGFDNTSLILLEARSETVNPKRPAVTREHVAL
jgi:protein phosphatase